MCGEHQNASRLSHGPLGSSPHVRGALRPSATIGLGCGIIPACAGSTLFCHRFFGRFRDHPRMCGEHLPESAICGHSRGSSPHVRGAQNLLPIMQDLDGIIPACAGSTCARLSARLEHGDHPRMCGEHLVAVDLNIDGSGIIPACAGSTTDPSIDSSPNWDHPRMCGEHVGDFLNEFLTSGSSPHVRGAPTKTHGIHQHTGIIPACAGSTAGTLPSRLAARDHPRMCGEHRVRILLVQCIRGSSPHVRGAHVRADELTASHGIIPACAGSTWCRMCCWHWTRDHPRMCGEHTSKIA